MTPTTTDNQKLTNKKSLVEVETSTKFSTMPSSLREALYQTFHSSKIPAKVIAQRMGVSYQLLANGLNLNSSLKFSAKHLQSLMQSSENYTVLRYLAEVTGHIIYRLPHAKKLERAQMIGLAFAAHQLIGRLLVRMGEGEIDRQDEARKIFLELSVLVEELSVLKSVFESKGWQGRKGNKNV